MDQHFTDSTNARPKDWTNSHSHDTGSVAACFSTTDSTCRQRRTGVLRLTWKVCSLWIKQLSRYINYKGGLWMCSHSVSSPRGFHLHFLPFFFITNWLRAASVTRTVSFLTCKGKRRTCTVYLCHSLCTGLLRVGEKTHAYWLGAAGRGEKKRYVPSDVIKAKIYLFSLCIHGEIVSTGSKLMYYCTNIGGAECLGPFPGFFFFF